MGYKKIFKRLILIVVCFSLVLTVSCGNAPVSNKVYKEIIAKDTANINVSLNEIENDVILESNNHKLIFNKISGTFSVLDKLNNVVWNSVADNSKDTVASGKERTNLDSIFALDYLDEEKNLASNTNTSVGAKILDSNTGKSKANIKIELKKNAIVVYYVFSELQIVVPLKFTLNSDGFNCTILSSRIVENSKYKILSISLLPYFGAASANENGYLFVPDGSGALAYFNDGKSSYEPYIAQLYGRDECIDVLTDSEKVQTARLPVFGLKKGNTGFLGVITEGDADAYITASVQGQKSSYNSISSKFTLRTEDSYTMGESNSNKLPQKVKVYEEKSLTMGNEQTKFALGNFTLRYYLLGENESDYNGMAQKYRKYLLSLYDFTESKSKPTIQIELPGAIRTSNKLFGVDIYKTTVLNDLDDIEKITEHLIANDVDNIDFKYTNWTKQQIKNQINDKAKVISKLGNKNDFDRFIEKYKNNINFYFDADFYEVENAQSKYKSFLAFKVSGKKALKYEYELENYLRSPYIKPKNLISPSDMNELVSKYVDTIKLKDAKISIDKICSNLTSDFKETGWTRSTSKLAVIQALKTITGEGKIMVSGGNVFSLPFAESVINAPESSSNFDFADVSVPFYQLVISGLLDYSYQPINSNTDPHILFLKSVETGAALHFYFVSQNEEHLPDTPEYSKYTSVSFNDWSERIIEYYSQLNIIYEATNGTKIVSHSILSNGVNETTYENGCRILTNYSNEIYNYNGIDILSNAYKIIPGGN